MTGMTGMTRMARRRHLVVRSGRMGTRRTVHGAGRNEQGQHKQPHAPEFAFHESRHFYSIQIYSFLRDRKIPPGHCPPRTARRPSLPNMPAIRIRMQTPGADTGNRRQAPEAEHENLERGAANVGPNGNDPLHGGMQRVVSHGGLSGKRGRAGPSGLTQRRQMTLKSQ